jgi:hypothetical protein
MAPTSCLVGTSQCDKDCHTSQAAVCRVFPLGVSCDALIRQADTNHRSGQRDTTATATNLGPLSGLGVAQNHFFWVCKNTIIWS